MFLLEKKAVTSLGKRFWLVKLKESKPQWKNRVGLSYRGSSTQWLADFVPRLWCTWPQSLSTSQTAESRLECEPPPPQVCWYQWMQGSLPSLTCPKSWWLLREFPAETLGCLLGFLNVGRALFNEVWWKLTSAGSRVWIPCSNLGKSPWHA